MKTLITSILLIIALAMPTTLISGQSKGFHLSYNGRVYELRQFKAAILAGIPIMVNGKKVKFRERLNPMLDDILYQSAKNNVDPILVVSVIWTESHFNTSAQSVKGAVGPMQLMPGTAHDIFTKLIKVNGASRYNVAHNIEGGVVYLAHLLKKFKQNETKAVIAYNMGPGYILSKNSNFKFDHQYYNKIKDRYAEINKTVAKKGLSQEQLFVSKSN